MMTSLAPTKSSLVRATLLLLTAGWLQVSLCAQEVSPPAAASGNSNSSAAAPVASEPPSGTPKVETQPAPLPPAPATPKTSPAAEAKPRASLIMGILRDPEVVELFAELPVLDSGRVKPLDTVARFRLKRNYGKQSIALTDTGATSSGPGKPKPVPLTDVATGKPLVDEKGKPIKLNAIEWLLVSWFEPEVAKNLPVFVVDNSEAVVALGVPPKGLRDYYTYNELQPYRDELMTKGDEIGRLDVKKRTTIQNAIRALSENFIDYELTLGHFNFARAPLGENISIVPKEIIPEGGPTPRIVELIHKLKTYLEANRASMSPETSPWLMDLTATMQSATMGRSDEQTLRLFAPDNKDEATWQNPGQLMFAELRGQPVEGLQLSELSDWENLYFTLNEPAAFKAQLKAFQEKTLKLANERGEGKRVAMEVKYHKDDYFFRALMLFIPALIIMSFSWASPESLWGKLCRLLTWLLMLGGTTYLAIGMTVRSLIMERPPVSSLYETIPFITFVAVVLALLIELVTRWRLGLFLSALAGVSGMFLLMKYSTLETTDTMQQLQPVLDTAFWLTTHVLIINMGYAACMLSAIIGMIYVLLRVTQLAKPGVGVAREATRVSYALLMAGLFLSLVGTILGGIWANDSWGRFWGWDPKENGALMIVLMCLITLHARLGGFIREVGFHACNIFLGMIVIFSWFGVNQIGVGLHAYGFIDGVWGKLVMFWISQLILLALAFIVSLWDRSAKKAAISSPAGGNLREA